MKCDNCETKITDCEQCKKPIKKDTDIICECENNDHFCSEDCYTNMLWDEARCTTARAEEE